MHERIAEVQFYFNHPQEYVRLKEDYAEYQDLIIERIDAKIKEFRAFNAQQRQDYLREQQDLRMAALQSQQQLLQAPINSATPPTPKNSPVLQDYSPSAGVYYARRFFQMEQEPSFIDEAIRGMTEYKEEAVRLLSTPGS